jgi:hypothetical protein
MAKRAMAYMQGGGDINQILPLMYQQLGLTPEEVQMYDPEIQRDPMGAMTALSMFGEEADAPGYDFQTVLDENGKEVVMAVNKRNPTDMKPIGGKPQKEEPYRYITMDGDEGPGIYVFQGNKNLGKLGGVVRAPSAGRQPTKDELLEAELVRMGIPVGDARKMRVGIMPIPGKETTGPLKNVIENRAKQNDAIDTAVGEIDRVLKAEDWQGGSGIENTVKGGLNLVTNAFDGKDLFQDQTRKSVDISNLQQTFVRALSADKRVVNDDFKRLEGLLPGNGIFDGEETARAKLAEVRKFFEEIRKRPLPTDPRLGNEPAEPTAETPTGADDPLGLFNAD